MKRVKVFSPRRQPLMVEFASTSTFADARARIRQEFKTPGTADILLLHGEMMKDTEVLGDKLKNEEEVLYFMEIIAPPKPATAPAANPFAGMGAAGRGMGRGAAPAGRGGGATAENLANILMQMQQRQQQGTAQRAAQPPAAAAAARQAAAPARPARQTAQLLQVQAEVPAALVSQLTDMGFSANKAKRALMLNNFDVLDAITWLSDHADDPDVEMSPEPQEAGASAPPQQQQQQQQQQQPSDAAVRMLAVLDPVLKAMAREAHGDAGLRGVLEGVRLPAMEADGWRGLAGVVHRVWGGERDEAGLCAGLDANTAALVRKMLQYVRMPAAQLEGGMDRNARAGMPLDPEFDKIEAQMQPMLRRVATMAVQQARMAMGDGDGCPPDEEKAVTDFVTQMEGANWQLRTPLEMLCAGVRTEGDLMECIAPLPTGKPDDRSTRLALSVMALVLKIEQGG